MSEYNIPLNEIERFLHGYDEEKYIVNITYDSKENLIYKYKHLPDGTKTVDKEPLTSFMWMKHLGVLKEKYNFYGNNHLNIKNAKKEYGIDIKVLADYDNERLKNGYKYLVTCTQGHSRMLEFFRKGGFDN